MCTVCAWISNEMYNSHDTASNTFKNSNITEVIVDNVNDAKKCNSVRNDALESNYKNNKDNKIFFDKDPAFWMCNEMTRDQFVVNGLQQHKNVDFFKSKKKHCDQIRYLNKCVFVKVIKNGETCDEMTWLVYSESLRKIVCGPCLLFNRENKN